MTSNAVAPTPQGKGRLNNILRAIALPITSAKSVAIIASSHNT